MPSAPSTLLQRLYLCAFGGAILGFAMTLYSLGRLPETLGELRYLMAAGFLVFWIPIIANRMITKSKSEHSSTFAFVCVFLSLETTLRLGFISYGLGSGGC